MENSITAQSTCIHYSLVICFEWMWMKFRRSKIYNMPVNINFVCSIGFPSTQSFRLILIVVLLLCRTHSYCASVFYRDSNVAHFRCHFLFNIYLVFRLLFRLVTTIKIWFKIQNLSELNFDLQGTCFSLFYIIKLAQLATRYCRSVI